VDRAHEIHAHISLNYAKFFLRDNLVMVDLILQRRFIISRHFLKAGFFLFALPWGGFLAKSHLPDRWGVPHQFTTSIGSLIC